MIGNWTVAGCLAVLPALLQAQTVGGVSALLLYPAGGVPIVDPSLLSNPNVDGPSVSLFWRDFYVRQDDPASPVDWTGLDAILAQAAKAGERERTEC